MNGISKLLSQDLNLASGSGVGVYSLCRSGDENSGQRLAIHSPGTFAPLLSFGNLLSLPDLISTRIFSSEWCLPLQAVAWGVLLCPHQEAAGENKVKNSLFKLGRHSSG